MCSECGVEETPKMIASADEAVAAGIVWLDRNGPDNWRGLVDLPTLDIDSPSDCILGQVFEDKAYNPEYTWAHWWNNQRTEFNSGYDYAVTTFLSGNFDDTTTALGFSGGLGINSYTMTAAWKRALTA